MHQRFLKCSVELMLKNKFLVRSCLTKANEKIKKVRDVDTVHSRSYNIKKIYGTDIIFCLYLLSAGI